MPGVQVWVLVPRNHQHTIEIDNTNRNNLWAGAEAEEKELGQQDDYQTFHDLGVGNYPEKGYKKSCVHFVYDRRTDEFLHLSVLTI